VRICSSNCSSSSLEPRELITLARANFWQGRVAMRKPARRLGETVFGKLDR